MFKPLNRFKAIPQKHTSPWIIYLIVFGLTLHLTPALYINSSFLETIIAERTVGLIYSIASIITIFVLFFLMTKSLKKFGNYKTFIGTMIIEFIALALLAIAPSAPVVIIAFMVHFITTSVAYMSIDIFLEDGAKEESMGGTRGILLSTVAVAFAVGPLISGKILETGMFWLVYVLGMVMLSIVIFVSMMKLRNFKDPEYLKVNKEVILNNVFVHKNIYFAMQTGFMLRFFYAWMIIYSPLLLRGIGFDWSQTGLILAIGLIPFIFLDAPLGIMADKYHSERTLLSIGFIIMSLSCFAIFFAPPILNIFMWSSIIFFGRIGAAFLETASESYLFKNIKSNDLSVLTFFRTIRPVAYVIAPIIASILIPFFGIEGLFLVLGGYLLYGLRYSLAIKRI